jgi:hypothetical protein
MSGESIDLIRMIRSEPFSQWCLGLVNEHLVQHVFEHLSIKPLLKQFLFFLWVIRHVALNGCLRTIPCTLTLCFFDLIEQLIFLLLDESLHFIKQVLNNLFAVCIDLWMAQAIYETILVTPRSFYWCHKSKRILS